MSSVSLLIKPASSLCNIKCSYCFYQDETKLRKNNPARIMNKNTVINIVSKFLNSYDEVTFAFQGGEPTLAGLDFYTDFIKTVSHYSRGNKVTYVIQTNGLLLDEDWLRFFKENNFLIGISLDGFKNNHDSYRGNGTFDTVMNTINRLKEYGIEYNILTVLASSLSEEPDKLFEFYKDNQFKYVQLIPYLPLLKDTGSSYRLRPEQFSRFHKRFFDLWYDQYQRGNYISISLYDDLILMYMNIYPSQCGMLGQCFMQWVIEADGSVYPCDFYCLDKYLCGNINTDTITDIYNSKNANSFTQPTSQSDLCQRCPFYKMCYGNCKRMISCYRSDTYCGYADFLKYSYDKMKEIAKGITI